MPETNPVPCMDYEDGDVPHGRPDLLEPLRGHNQTCPLRSANGRIVRGNWLFPFSRQTRCDSAQCSTFSLAKFLHDRSPGRRLGAILAGPRLADQAACQLAGLLGLSMQRDSRNPPNQTREERDLPIFCCALFQFWLSANWARRKNRNTNVIGGIDNRAEARSDCPCLDRLLLGGHRRRYPVARDEEPQSTFLSVMSAVACLAYRIAFWRFGGGTNYRVREWGTVVRTIRISKSSSRVPREDISSGKT